MLAQRLLSSIAQTNTLAAMKYEQEVRDYHKKLRQFYYPLIFNKTEFNQKNLLGLPQFITFKNTLNTHKEKI
jgi:ABC-2 type transport system permease protein